MCNRQVKEHVSLMSRDADYSGDRSANTLVPLDVLSLDMSLALSFFGIFPTRFYLWCFVRIISPMEKNLAWTFIDGNLNESWKKNANIEKTRNRKTYKPHGIRERIAAQGKRNQCDIIMSGAWWKGWIGFPAFPTRHIFQGKFNIFFL